MDPIEQLLEKARERYEKTGKYTNFLTGRPCNPENGYDNRHHICCLKNDDVTLRKFSRLMDEINRREKEARVQRITLQEIRFEEMQAEKWKDFPQFREEFDDLHMKMDKLHYKMDEMLELINVLMKIH